MIRKSPRSTPSPSPMIANSHTCGIANRNAATAADRTGPRTKYPAASAAAINTRLKPTPGSVASSSVTSMHEGEDRRRREDAGDAAGRVAEPQVGPVREPPPERRLLRRGGFGGYDGGLRHRRPPRGVRRRSRTTPVRGTGVVPIIGVPGPYAAGGVPPTAAAGAAPGAAGAARTTLLERSEVTPLAAP